MISIRKYLYSDQPGVVAAEPENGQYLAISMECYRALMCAIGKSAVQICPALGEDLESNLNGLQRRLGVGHSPESIQRTQNQVEIQLQEWGARTAEHFKTLADEVKELLIALAKTAESVGSRDQGYSSRFRALTGELERIAGLNDLTQIRTSLVKSVTELKTSVVQMTEDNQQLVLQLQAEISTYENRLKSAERLALKDDLTGVANRRSVEERIQWSIASQQKFSIVIVDLNRFKEVNDRHGHLAGDELLKQFAAELQSKTRSGDLVGRLGGDEFMIVLACDAQAARAHIGRIEQWVFGKYTIQGSGATPIVVQVDAAIGIAEWDVGQTLEQLVSAADSAMYADKQRYRADGSRDLGNGRE